MGVLETLRPLKRLKTLVPWSSTHPLNPLYNESRVELLHTTANSQDPLQWVHTASQSQLDHLIAQQKHKTDQWMHTIKPLQHTIKQEMMAHLPPFVASHPEPLSKNGSLYHIHQSNDKPHPCFIKTNYNNHRETEVILDVNELAQVYGDVFLGQVKLSRCQRHLAFTLSEAGGEDGYHHGFTKDLATGKIIQHPRLEGVVNLEWADDVDSSLSNRLPSLLFTTADDMGRPCMVFKLVDSATNTSSVSADAIYQDDDARFFVDLQRTKDWKYLIINSVSKTTSEAILLPANTPNTTLKPFQPRIPGLQYFIEHRHGVFCIMSNARGATNFALFSSSSDNNKGDYREHTWKLILSEDKDMGLEDIDVFDCGVVVYGRKQAIPIVCFLPGSGGAGCVDTDNIRYFQDEYNTRIYTSIKPGGMNANFDSTTLRLELASPIQPPITVDWDLVSTAATRVTRLEDATTIDSSTGSSNKFYCHQVLVPSSSSSTSTTTRVTVPMTLIHDKHLVKNSNNPCLVIVYGSYGHCIPTDYQPELLPLLNRGWVVALIHARGGGEGGKLWHDAGLGRHKRNTIADIEAGLKYLVENKYSRPGRFAIEASSAGGVVAGGVIHRQAAGYFRAAVLESPFVDMLHTMKDEKLPLVVHEREEFGDPNDPSQLEWMQHICPYSQLLLDNNNNSGVYSTAMLVSFQQSDSRIPFTGVLKYVLRAQQKNDRVVALIDAFGGHAPPDGERFDFKSIQYSFLIQQMSQ